MGQILRFNDFQKVKEANASYSGEWPMNKQNVGLGAEDVANDQQYAKKENTFQEVQEQMKIILKPIILKKNPNADDRDIEKIVESFFNLGAEKAGQVKQMVDGCKDTKKCAQDIVNQYLKYVKINFNTKDNVNDVEQDSVMTSEKVKKFGEVCPDCDGRGYIPGEGKCKTCKGTGLAPGKKRAKNG